MEIKKWEYLFVYRRGFADWKVEGEKRTFCSLQEALRELGKDGWEFVLNLTGTRCPNMELVFKRPLC